MSFVGAIDQGTTSTRFIVFDRAGNIVSSAQRPFTQHLPEEGRTEHDPLEIWRTVEECVQEALGKPDAPGNKLGRTIALDELASVGITNQRETTVVWDKNTGRPLYRALVWMDMRSEGIVADLKAAHPLGQNRFLAKTGLPVSPYFSGTKIMWLLEHVPGLRALAERGDALFGTIDTWLLWKLSGGAVHATDVTNASRTLLMDIQTLAWDDGQCAALGVPRAMLPEIRSSSEVYCRAAEGTPLAGVKIAGILGDQQAALFGQAGMATGSCKNTYGTGCFTLCNVGPKCVFSRHGLLSTVAFKLGSGPNDPGGGRVCYALEGSVPFAGACVEWLVKRLELIPDAPSTSEIADEQDNGGVYFVPAFSGLYAPYWRDDARGVIVGLTRYANRAHLVRAALEAVCFQTREVCDAMRQDAAASGVNLGDMSILKVDGGMTVNARLMQMQADILKAEVQRPTIVETTALGAAYAAGLAVKFWASEDEVMSQWQLDKTFCPQEHLYSSHRRNKEFSRWKRAVRRTLNWSGEEEEQDPADVSSGGRGGTSGRGDDAGALKGLLSPVRMVAFGLGALVGAGLAMAMTKKK